MARLRRTASPVVLLALAFVLAGVVCDAQNASRSQPGGAGHALLFRDHILVKKDFTDFPTTAMTFEAWLSTSDFCHAGTIMSYAKDSKATDEDIRIADFNHFVIFDPRNLLACHDFTYIDLEPDPRNQSCHASYTNVSGRTDTVSYVERDARWHHLAVTWSAEPAGLTEVFFDGLRVASAYTQKSAPLEPGGAFMLGGEQDCYGGCTDPSQGFYGLMDEVRLWKVVRSQDDIIRHMRWASGLENHKDLVGYWKFNDPDRDNGEYRRHLVAKDSSGKGNDLVLANPPFRADVEVAQPAVPGGPLHTGKLEFKNNVAVSRATKGMPDKSFTVEFWARGAAMPADGAASSSIQRFSQLLSYAAQKGEGSQPSSSTGVPDFMDDAIRVERYLEDFSPKLGGGHSSTAGSISVHINSNENTDSGRGQNWIDFDAQWTDDKWHHVAVTWDYEDGKAQLFFDGGQRTPFWKSDGGVLEDKAAREGGVDPHVAPRSPRSSSGSLALGQDQDCFGGCFSPSNAFNGDLAVLRIWNRVLTADEVKRNMWRERPDTEAGLAALYIFGADGVKPSEGGAPLAVDRSPNANHLELRNNPPQWAYSYAPLTAPDSAPVMPPVAGGAGYAMRLHDRQVLMLPTFQDFPSDAITVEFWMQSIDTCRPGVPFSYAHGQYETDDNAFLIFNYNSWGVSVLEDEGTLADHLSGVSATDGHWHHIAVTWESASGQVNLYDNGRLVWSVVRSKGKTIPSGGTLIIGREQDCLGGCFDSAKGALGRVSEIANQEYGPQDFFGLIEEMRVWKVARTQAQIAEGIRADSARGGSNGAGAPVLNRDDPTLVAYWKFDEGTGYTVRDATNHGHDLIAAEPPTWEVVRWLSTCGNAVVEGWEECDDGDLADGNGCSSSCTIEPGFTCLGSPSVCTRGGGGGSGGAGGGGAAPTPSWVPSGGGSSGGAPAAAPAQGGGGSGSSSSGGSIAAAVLVPVFAFVLFGALFAYRHAVYEAFPQVEAGAEALQRQLAAVLPGVVKPPSSSRFGHLSLDPEELDMSPEFLAPTPARPPGLAGAYQPLPDAGLL